MVARGNQWKPRTNNEAHLKFWENLTTYNGYNMSKYASNFKIPHYHPLNQWLLWATNGNQGQIMMHI